MTQRNRKRLLVACNAVFGAALAAAAAGFLLPLDLPAETGKGGSAATQPAAVKKLDPLNAYAVIYQRDMRKPLFETPATETPAEAAPVALQLKLKGTAVEPGYSYAMFENAAGDLTMATVGDKVDGAEVVSIGDDSVTAKYGGHVIKIAIEKEAGQ